MILRISLFSLLLVTLASCGMSTTQTNTSTGGTASGATTSTGNTLAATGSMVTLNYTLHTGSVTGPIVETTLMSVAQANGLYKTGAKFEPFQVVLGQSQTIPGFEAGLMGVKTGEKKVIVVTPDQGYGHPVTVPDSQIAPEFNIVVSKDKFQDTLTQTIEKSQFPPEMKASVEAAKVGSTLTGVNNLIAKVTVVTPTGLTLEIQNTQNPFYKKTLAVGTTGSNSGATFEIKKIEGENVTLYIVNKESPFYGKTLASGATATTPDGQKLTITAVNTASGTVSFIPDHPLGKETLYFDIEVVNVQ